MFDLYRIFMHFIIRGLIHKAIPEGVGLLQILGSFVRQFDNLSGKTLNLSWIR